MTNEEIGLSEARDRTRHWKRWGPYLSEAYGVRCGKTTVPKAMPGTFFPRDHARSRAYRWNEDGIAGICDRRQLIRFALALWNERDPILKERLFGLSDVEDIFIKITVTNHGPESARLRLLPTIWLRNTWSSDQKELRPNLRGVSHRTKPSQLREALALLRRFSGASVH